MSFPMSSWPTLRISIAGAFGTAVHYIKLNDENLDPLGEDIYGALKQQSPAALPVTA